MIAYLLKKFPRLSETFILNELLGLEGQGLDLRVFSRRAPDDEPHHPELARLRATVELMPHSRRIDPWSILFSGETRGADLLERLPEVVAPMRALEHPRFGELVSEALWLSARCEQLGVTHLHVHFATDAAFVACLLRALGGPTYSVTLHAKDIYRDTVSPVRLRRVLEDAAFAVTVCDANAEHIRDFVGADAQMDLRRLYNGIDLESHALATGARDVDHILAVGRLVEKKGFGILLDAVAELRRRGRSPRVSLVGAGDLADALADQVVRLGLGEQVELLGAVDQDRVRGLLRTATVFALPCVIGADGNRDALPTVLLEALAAGLPCVSTPVTGVPEILDHGRAGRLVPQHDPHALADVVLELLDDAGERERLAAVGRARAAELFDVRANTAALASWLSAVPAPGEAPCASSR